MKGCTTRDVKGWWACGPRRMKFVGIRRMGVLAIMACLAAAGGARPGAAADSAEAFYKGKTMQLLIGFGPGGGYELYSKAVARRYAKPLLSPATRPWCRRTCWPALAACVRRVSACGCCAQGRHRHR